MKFLHPIFLAIGFRYKYEMKVTGEAPEQHGDVWSYKVKPQSRSLYWLGIKLHTVQLTKHF